MAAQTSPLRRDVNARQVVRGYLSLPSVTNKHRRVARAPDGYPWHLRPRCSSVRLLCDARRWSPWLAMATRGWARDTPSLAVNDSALTGMPGLTNLPWVPLSKSQYPAHALSESQRLCSVRCLTACCYVGKPPWTRTLTRAARCIGWRPCFTSEDTMQWQPGRTGSLPPI
jgi:hypothetical protein